MTRLMLDFREEGEILSSDKRFKCATCGKIGNIGDNYYQVMTISLDGQQYFKIAYSERCADIIKKTNAGMYYCRYRNVIKYSIQKGVW